MLAIVLGRSNDREQIEGLFCFDDIVPSAPSSLLPLPSQNKTVFSVPVFLLHNHSAVVVCLVVYQILEVGKNARMSLLSDRSTSTLWRVRLLGWVKQHAQVFSFETGVCLPVRRPQTCFDMRSLVMIELKHRLKAFSKHDLSHPPIHHLQTNNLHNPQFTSFIKQYPYQINSSINHRLRTGDNTTKSSPPMSWQISFITRPAVPRADHRAWLREKRERLWRNFEMRSGAEMDEMR